MRSFALLRMTKAGAQGFIRLGFPVVLRIFFGRCRTLFLPGTPVLSARVSIRLRIVRVFRRGDCLVCRGEGSCRDGMRSQGRFRGRHRNGRLLCRRLQGRESWLRGYRLRILMLQIPVVTGHRNHRRKFALHC